MIDCGPYGETVYNAAGSFTCGSKKYYFCLLSRGYLNKTPPITPDHMKQQVVKTFARNVPTS
jgi:hypothetical protein